RTTPLPRSRRGTCLHRRARGTTKPPARGAGLTKNPDVSHELSPDELSTGRCENHTPLLRKSIDQGKASPSFCGKVGFSSTRQAIRSVPHRTDEFTSTTHERELNTAPTRSGHSQRIAVLNSIGDQFGNNHRDIVEQVPHTPFTKKGGGYFTRGLHGVGSGLEGPREGIVTVSAQRGVPTARAICQDSEPPRAPGGVGERIRTLHAWYSSLGRVRVHEPYARASSSFGNRRPRSRKVQGNRHTADEKTTNSQVARRKKFFSSHASHF